MTRDYLAFTDTGLALAKRLAVALPGSVARCGRDGVSLAEWSSAQFVQSDALIFVGAAGIAVRAIAPHCKSKTTDPAVVVVDECGRFAVPILSGHLGGANDLARAIAAVCGAVPVLTTATTDGSSQLHVKGSLNSTADSHYRIEFFADPSGQGDARVVAIEARLQALAQVEAEIKLVEGRVMPAEHARAEFLPQGAEDDPQVDHRRSGGVVVAQPVPEGDALDVQVQIGRLAADLAGKQGAGRGRTPAVRPSSARC